MPDGNTAIFFSFGCFVLLFLGIGAFAAKLSKGTEQDYLTGDRNFGPWFVGLSAGATGNSGFIMLGAVGMGYTMGLSGFLLGLSWFLGDLTFWSIFPGKINEIARQRKSSTIPQLIASVLPVKEAASLRRLAGLLTIILVGAYLAAQYTAAAKTLNVFFGVELRSGILISALAILAYCTTGGLRASVWTDFVQALVMIGITAGMLLHIYAVAGGYTEIAAKLIAIDPKLCEVGAGFTAWTLAAYVVGYAGAGFGFDISQPQILVRLLAGRSPEDVRKAKWIYLLFIQSTWICMVLFGVIARILVPDIADPEQALPIYAMAALNPWVVGVVFAGMFSAIASTADSQLLVCSSSLAIDVLPEFHKHMQLRLGIYYHYGATLIVGTLGAVAAILCSSSVFTVIIFATSALACSLGPSMFISLAARRTSLAALSVSMLSGLAFAVVWRLLEFHDTMNESLPGFLFALAVHEALCRCMDRSDK